MLLRNEKQNCIPRALCPRLATPTPDRRLTSPQFRGGWERSQAGCHQGLSPERPPTPTPPHPVRRADGAEYRHRAAAARHHSAAHRGRRRRQRPRQGGLLQPQVPARGLLLRWVPPPGWGGGSGSGRRAEGGAAPRTRPHGAGGWGLEAGSELSREQNRVQCGGRATLLNWAREGGLGGGEPAVGESLRRHPGEGERAEPWVPGAEKALGRGMSGPV